MAGTFPAIYRYDRSLHILGIHATYRARSEMARRGKSDRSVTCPTDSF
jgi:hypothetical protein